MVKNSNGLSDELALSLNSHLNEVKNMIKSQHREIENMKEMMSHMNASISQLILVQQQQQQVIINDKNHLNSQASPEPVLKIRSVEIKYHFEKKCLYSI